MSRRSRTRRLDGSRATNGKGFAVGARGGGPPRLSCRRSTKRPSPGLSTLNPLRLARPHYGSPSTSHARRLAGAASSREVQALPPRGSPSRPRGPRRHRPLAAMAAAVVAPPLRAPNAHSDWHEIRHPRFVRRSRHASFRCGPTPRRANSSSMLPTPTPGYPSEDTPSRLFRQADLLHAPLAQPTRSDADSPRLKYCAARSGFSRLRATRSIASWTRRRRVVEVARDPRRRSAAFRLRRSRRPGDFRQRNRDDHADGRRKIAPS